MKRFIAFFFCAAAVCADAETVYTVTTDAGTYDAPVKLDALDVTVDDGTTVETKKFSEVYGDFSAGAAVFRKRGGGWMMSSTNMAEFTGEIRVEEGAFMVNTNLMTGPLNISTAPTVVVSNGASFVLAAKAADIAQDGLKLYNGFQLDGEGVDGHGAIANLLDRKQEYLFNGSWWLNGDTLLCGRSSQRYDLVSTCEVNMQGHTLTVRKGVENSSWPFVCGSAKFKTPGHIVVNGTTIQPQGGSLTFAWDGDASNTLTLTNSAQLSNYNTRIRIPWTLVAEANASISPGGSSTSYCDVGYTNVYDYWHGPVVFKGKTKISSAYVRKGFTVNGPLSGIGPVTVEKCWLQLTQPGSDYTGWLCATDANALPAGIALYCDGAVPPTAAGISLTNASLRLMADTAYALPKIEYATSVSNMTFFGGRVGSTAAGFVKRGAYALAFDAPIAVTGIMEIAEGRVTLPLNPHAGFVFGESGPTNNASVLVQGAVVFSNCVVYSTHLAYTAGSVGKSNTVMWTGHLWNRGTTNAKWTFAFAMNQGMKFRFDGKEIMWDYSFQANKRAIFNTLDVTPGPHLAEFRVYGSQSSGGGPLTANYITNAVWKDAFGIAIDKLGRGSTNCADFTEIADPGDGSFVTVSADGSLPNVAYANPSFTALKMSPAAELDTRGGNVSLKTLEGLGTLMNTSTYFTNTVSLADRWTVRAPQLVGGGTLAVQSGRLEFGDTCIFGVEDVQTLQYGVEYTVARADAGINRKPSLSSTLDKASWRLALTADRTELHLFHISGTIISVR